MSAIFGKFHYDQRPVSSSELLAMQQEMAYWGPDGDGSWSEDHVGLGHLRRDNTPESLGDTLPRICPASGDVITASVRLDNRDELMEALAMPHPGRANVPDSYIILDAYHKWGEACVDRLLGDWVFAIWNARERKLFLARDHHGNTGLYYHSDSRSFAFASSLKGLLTLAETPRRPNPLAIAQVLTVWPAQGAPTCYEGILRLPPAHAMTVKPSGVEVKRYWYVEDTPELHLGTDDDYIDAFLEIYDEAVRARLRSSAPVGITLSGGLDSGSVAALAARELRKRGQNLVALSSVPIASTKALFKRGIGDETPFIEATAQFIGNIDLNYIDARGVSPVAAIDRALRMYEQPVHGVGNMYWLNTLMAEAKTRGLGALLIGQGGNGTISWAGGPKTPLLEYLLKGQWGTFRTKMKAWQEATEHSLWQGIKRQIIRPLVAPIRQRQLRSQARRDAWREYSALNPALARELDLSRRMEEAGHDPTFKQKRDPVQARLGLVRPGRASVGHLWYEIGAAYDLDVRDPTFDPRVMSFCWSLPQGQYVHEFQDRWLIRRATAGLLPEKVRWNRRLGVQAADLAQRVLDHASDMEAALAEVEGSGLAREYLDVPKMRGVFDSVQKRIDPESSSQCGTVLLRGLMAGLFLLRFD